MIVELKQLVGRRSRKDVYLPVDRVFVDGRQVGLIERRDGARLNFIISGMPAEQREAIRQECQRIRDENGEFKGIDARTSAPPVIPKEIAEEYFGTEDDDTEITDDE